MTIKMISLTLITLPETLYDSSIIYNVDRSNEVEDAEHDARMFDMLKKIQEQQA